MYCRAPQGGYYKTALGTRCDIRCRKGYELHGSSQLVCQSDKRWSDKVICKREYQPWWVLGANQGQSSYALRLGLVVFILTERYVVPDEKNSPW